MGFSFKVTRKYYVLYVVRDVFKVVTEDAKTPPVELVLLFFCYLWTYAYMILMMVLATGIEIM